jgi:hypothetical protein
MITETLSTKDYDLLLDLGFTEKEIKYGVKQQILDSDTLLRFLASQYNLNYRFDLCLEKTTLDLSLNDLLKLKSLGFSELYIVHAIASLENKKQSISYNPLLTYLLALHPNVNASCISPYIYVPNLTQKELHLGLNLYCQMVKEEVEGCKKGIWTLNSSELRISRFLHNNFTSWLSDTNIDLALQILLSFSPSQVTCFSSAFYTLMCNRDYNFNMISRFRLYGFTERKSLNRHESNQFMGKGLGMILVPINYNYIERYSAKDVPDQLQRYVSKYSTSENTSTPSRVNADGNHWCLASIDFNETTVEVFDSLQRDQIVDERLGCVDTIDFEREILQNRKKKHLYPIYAIFANIKRFLEDKARQLMDHDIQPNFYASLEDWKFSLNHRVKPGAHQQENSFDCGVYTILAAEQLAQGKLLEISMKDKTSSLFHRTRLAFSIVLNRPVDMSDLLFSQYYKKLTCDPSLNL